MHEMRTIVSSDLVEWASVSCQYITWLHHAKMAEQIKVLFGTHWDPSL